MTSFVIGKIIEPEIKEVTVKKSGDKREIVSFGLLSGKNCNQFDVWPDSKVYSKVKAFKEGETVLAVIGTAVDDRGRLQCYLNAVGTCPKDLRAQLMEAVKN